MFYDFSSISHYFLVSHLQMRMWGMFFTFIIKGNVSTMDLMYWTAGVVVLINAFKKGRTVAIGVGLMCTEVEVISLRQCWIMSSVFALRLNQLTSFQFLDIRIATKACRPDIIAKGFRQLPIYARDRRTYVISLRQTTGFNILC